MDSISASLANTSPTDESSEADIKETESEPIPHAHMAEEPLIEVESQDSIRSKRTRKDIRWEELTLGKSGGGPQPQLWAPRSAKQK